ncbi:MAG TPA: ZIP family metal transporter [Clostridiaceae bacterium]|nr:ZIP family metal transporter [Clostridium sp.]HJJ12048.1 ZIP family metal transporter [Clostridiaceae bacterium]
MEILKVVGAGLFFGTFGTTLGGLIGIKLKNNSNKFLGFILSFAAGLMMAIICFDLLPEAMEIANLAVILLGILCGIATMIICDTVVKEKFRGNNKVNNLLKTGIIISIGLALHNIPEGLAIGTGFSSSLNLGISLAIVIAIHDIPEGISMAVPMKNGGMSSKKVIFYVIMSGISTGIGALVGHLIGGISETIIASSLSFAGGAMLYIASGELTLEANNMYKGRMNAIGNILGFILGIIAINI